MRRILSRVFGTGAESVGRHHPDLASIRAPSALNRLPDSKRTAWQALWRDVDELAERLAKADETKTDQQKPKLPTAPSSK